LLGRAWLLIVRMRRRRRRRRRRRVVATRGGRVVAMPNPWRCQMEKRRQ
jgi:hypothetical protein